MRWVRFLIIGIVVFVVLEGALLVAVVANPDIEREVRNTGSAISDVWLGSEETGGILRGYRSAASEAFEHWITPLWRAPRPEEPDFVFSGCLECHQGYFEQQVFDEIYFVHRPHYEESVECATCHLDTTHPNPQRPAMQTCAECHSEVETPGECEMCHGPGSLDHYERLGVPADSHRDCTACHVAALGGDHDRDPLIAHPTFDGSDAQLCTSCHVDAFCAMCHDDKHEPGWLSTHGAWSMSQGMATCFDCHSGTTCGPCHENSPPLPLPTDPP